jgi:hypothetical protein
MWETRDVEGRRVSLALEAWLHIVEAHPELALDQREILSIVEAPEHHMPGRAEREEWYYRSGLGPSRWAKVVVHFKSREGKLVTAFPRRRFP